MSLEFLGLRKLSEFNILWKIVQSDDIASNTFDEHYETFSDQFWVEVEQYNDLLNRGSGEAAGSTASPIFLCKSPCVR